jgi:hypothetical protein
MNSLPMMVVKINDEQDGLTYYWVADMLEGETLPGDWSPDKTKATKYRINDPHYLIIIRDWKKFGATGESASETQGEPV